MFKNVFCPSCSSDILNDKVVRIGTTKAVRKIKCRDCRKDFSIGIIED